MFLFTSRLVFLILFFLPLSLFADTIILENGDRLQGEIISTTDDAIIFKHTVLGELNIARSSISSLAEAAPVEVNVEPAAEEVVDAGDMQDDGFLHSGWLTGWKRQLAVGIDGAAGKSDNSKINISFTANYEDEQKRWAHETKYYRDESDGELTDHTLTASLNHDWLLPESPKFYFAGGHIDFDEFKDWDERIAVNLSLIHI